jgi:hypothetical protein
MENDYITSKWFASSADSGGFSDCFLLVHFGRRLFLVVFTVNEPFDEALCETESELQTNFPVLSGEADHRAFRLH